MPILKTMGPAQINAEITDDICVSQTTMVEDRQLSTVAAEEPGLDGAPDVPEETVFKVNEVHEAEHSKAFKAYMEYLNASQDSLIVLPADAKPNSFIKFLEAQLDLYCSGSRIEDLPLTLFDNTVKVPAGSPSFFPTELYPSQAVIAGVGNKEARYIAQLKKIYESDACGGLAFVAMRRFFYSKMTFRVRPLKNRKFKLDFVRILDNFIDERMVQLLHVADEYFGPEMEVIKMQQQKIAEAAVESANSSDLFYENVREVKKPVPDDQELVVENP